MTQILANRISLIQYDPVLARKLKLAVALAIGVLNVSVFVLWIPARLQISPTWVQANIVWDRIEKGLFLVIDLLLNVYFMRLVNSQLIANGLIEYVRVYRFDVVMVCVSIALDVSTFMGALHSF